MTSKRQLDWKEVGKFLAVLLNLFKIIRDTLKPMSIGIEFIPWLIGEGRELFIKLLKALGEEFLAFEKIISTPQKQPTVGKFFMTVTLGAYKDTDALDQAVLLSGKRIEDCVKKILKKITICPTEMDVDIYEVSGTDLGFTSVVTPREIYKRALKYGFKKSSAEVGILTRIKCSDCNPRVIGMDPITNDDGTLCLFLTLRSEDKELLLDAYHALPDTAKFEPHFVWLFIWPRLKHCK